MFWVGLVCFLLSISVLYSAWLPVRRAFLDKPKSPQDTLEIQKYKDMYEADRNLFWTHAGIVAAIGTTMLMFGNVLDANIQSAMPISMFLEAIS